MPFLVPLHQPGIREPTESHASATTKRVEPEQTGEEIRQNHI